MERLAIKPAWLKAELEKPGRSQAALARYMGLEHAAIVNRMTLGKRKISAEEADKIRQYLAVTARGADADGLHIDNTPDLPVVDPLQDYVEVEVLPTYAGMGGGGTGEGDHEIALISRRLLEDELRLRPVDALLINVRGDSMIDPATGKGFLHGDQLLIDRRDVSPTQPGAFALWYDDGYVVKNVERIRRTGKLRVFSNNPAYSPEEFDPDEIRIMGRPVWFARRL